MATLSDNWMTENIMDFEYKKYILLGYLKRVKEQFKQQKLYPDLAELIAHYKNLLKIKSSTYDLEQGFKKNIKSIDFKSMKFVYENAESDETINELKQIIDFSEPLMACEVKEGQKLFEFAEKHISGGHIGILPLYKKEGYFILHPYQEKNIQVYNYSFTKVNLLQQEVYGLQTTYFSNFKISLGKTIDSIKHEIIEVNPQMPNPAVYLFQAKTLIPNEETFLPIAKRLLHRKITDTTY